MKQKGDGPASPAPACAGAPAGRSAGCSKMGEKMMLLVRPFFMGFCLWLAAWMGATPALGAGVSCEAWNTRVFFERAGVADVSRCLKAGADVNARDENGATPLHRAAWFSTTPAVVTALLNAGANVNARTENGATPLHQAAWNSTTPAIVTALVKAGADVNARDEIGWTPLHVAAMFSTTTAIVTALLDAGADVNARDKYGKTPLHRAARFSTTPAVVTALVKAGADPAARDKNRDRVNAPWDHIKADSPLKGTDVYWRLNEGRFK